MTEQKPKKQRKQVISSEVFALKEPRQILHVRDFLTKHYGTHYSDIWMLGVNIALRISDLLNLTMEDARVGISTGCIVVLEQKTAYRTKNKGTENEERFRTKVRPRYIQINKTAAEILRNRLDSHPGDEYLFQSHCNRAGGQAKALTRQAVYYAFREAGNSIGVKIGTHSMRKTMGYQMHKAGVKLADIANFLNHSNSSVTMRYIGLDKEATAEMYHTHEIKFD